MKRFLALALLLTSTLTAHAERFKPVKLPTPIQATIPRKASQWLSGTIAGNPRLFLAFYSVPTSEAGQPATFKLDIWQRSGKAKPRRLHSITLPNNDYFTRSLTEKERGYAIIKASTEWLRPSTRQTPILRLSCESFNGANANTRGMLFLLVFPRGLKNKPFVQEFENHSDWDGGVAHALDKIDETGIVRMTRTFWGHHGDSLTSETLRWNGTAFLAPPKAPVVCPPAPTPDPNASLPQSEPLPPPHIPQFETPSN
jgi:hypothetical protein